MTSANPTPATACTCAEQSWFGPEHASACPLADQPPSTWHTLVATFEAAHHQVRLADAPGSGATDETTADLQAAMWDAWKAVLHCPAQDLEAVAYKARLMLLLHVERPEDDLDVSDFQQRLLDEDHIECGFPIVRVLQDVLRLAGVSSPVLDLTRSIEKPWPVFAARYRLAVSRLMSDFASSPDDDATDALNEAHGAAYHTLLHYPVQTSAELAEKIELLGLDCVDDGTAFKVVAADAKRLAAA